MVSNYPSSLHFPIDPILPVLRDSLKANTQCILEAPPGAGKTTRVPPSLLTESWLENRSIIMLEPRRIAARRAAEFMALQLGEKAGETVGYRIRNETCISKQTRIEVVTEGILTRMLHSDAALSGTGLIIFDEFHERSIHADLGLAFALDVQKHLRPDLRILIMSATLNASFLAEFLGSAPVVRSEGKMFPVETRYAKFRPDKPKEVQTAETVIRALQEGDGDILVFLPGRREILRTENLLYEKKIGNDAAVHLLYGEASRDQQEAALAPDQHGKRKIILSTSVAETSVTIDGVSIVIDSGLSRVSRFDPRSGMTALVTVPAAKATADQRRGRAGRQGPGICFRLWTEGEHSSLPDFQLPEILSADLAPLALDLAAWGDPDGASLQFPDMPPLPHLRQAQSLLRNIGAVDGRGILTPHGKKIAGLPVHPRLAHMIIRGKELRLGALACDIAALIEERDLFAGKKDADIDLAVRLHELSGSQRSSGIPARLAAQSQRLRSLTSTNDSENDFGDDAAGVLLALAYPDRIAKRREKNRYLMAQGTTAVLPESSLLNREEYLAVGDADLSSADARIFLAAPLSKNSLISVFGADCVNEKKIFWEEESDSLRAVRISRLGALTLSEQPFDPTEEESALAMIERIRSAGLRILPFTKETESFRRRSEWLRLQGFVEDNYPDLSDAALLSTMNVWLSPFLRRARNNRQLQQLEMMEIIKSVFDYQQLAFLNSMAPPHLLLPSGSKAAIQYESGSAPVLAVRLQELFGQINTPTIANGRTALLIHLLSPAKRPLAVTQDLKSFWTTVYPEIRRQMRAKYPKHVWPEDPLTAAPTSRTKKFMKNSNSSA